MQISRTDQDDTTTLALTGSLDAATAANTDAPFEAVLAEGRKQVTLELSGLEHIDNAGVAKIMGLHMHLKQRGGALHIAGIRDQPRAIFCLLRYDAVFPEIV